MAGQVGLDPLTWEQMTPAAFVAYVRGVLDGEKTRLEEARATAYNLAVMVRDAIYSNRMPKYESYFQKQKKPMSDDDMYDTVVSLNKALGGNFGD
jgi:enamine deaminase RidA (YjgF/YER057c/UK114 family)